MRTIPIIARLLISTAAVTAAAAVVSCAGRTRAAASPPAPSPPRSTLAPAQRSELAIQADSAFWQVFHAGAYEAIPQAMLSLMLAYLQNPHDAQVTAHIGFLHAWQLAENGRLSSLSPSITDHAALARKFFDRALKQAPDDARYRGFASAMALVEAGLDGDTEAWGQALAKGEESIRRWPQFNWFTMGYTLSSQPFDSPEYRKALEWQWQTMDRCSAQRVDRANPTLVKITTSDPRITRACGNSWIAPHNIEGFFLNMGDMLVKSGDWQLGRKVYALAQATPSYTEWPYRQVLEARIANAEANVATLRKGQGNGAVPTRRGVQMMVQSPFSCSSCHQLTP